MNLKTSKLRDAIALAIVAGATTVAGTGVAFAQNQTPAQPTDQSATTLDRVTVTGSRIRQVDIETAQPVTFITREDIERQGFQTAADILQNISATGTPPLTRASPLSSGELGGGTYISLRNLGAQRTLVLMNGRRLGISTSGFADIALIPASAIERIEVLKDGASSIYGSDAIAGVINIITRTNYEGAQASVYYGQYSQGDGGTTRGDMVMGFNGDRGSVTVAAEWGDDKGVVSSNRAFSATPRGQFHPTDNFTIAGQVGGFVTTAATPVPGVPTGTRVVLRDGGNPRNIADYRAQNTNSGTCSVAAGATAAGCIPGVALDKSNTNLQTDLRTPQENRSFFIDGVLDVTDNVRARTNLMYASRVNERTVAGYPMQAAPFGTTMAANSYFNPTGAPITNWFRRTWEIPRVSTSDLANTRVSFALEGSFETFNRFFDWDVSYLRSEHKLNQTSYGNLNLANTTASVGPSFLNTTTGQVQCGTGGVAIAGCVPFNPFLAFGVAGQGALTGNDALIAYLFQEEHSTGKTSTDVYAANLAGSIFALPAGDLGFAVGLEHRKEKGAFVPDALAVTGGSTNLAGGPTSGQYSVDEVYAELQIPLLANMPFFQELTLDVAGRYSDYDTFGDTTNYKYGLKWKPIESLLVRATMADGFRAPTVANLFGGGSQTFSFFTDPCDTNFGQSTPGSTVRQNCTNGVGGNGALGALASTYRQLTQGFNPAGAPNTQTPVAFTSGSNPTLIPEVSESKTIGLVWSPTFVDGLNVALDWWNIRIEQTIVADTPTTILNDCYVQGIASRCSPALFTRDAALGFPVVTFGDRNAGFREVEGFDFDISYRWGTEAFGSYSVALNSTYTVSDVLISTNDPRFPLSSVGTAGSPRIRANMNIGWDMGDWGVSWIARHYSSMKEGCTYFVVGTNTPHLECNEIGFRPNGALLADGSPQSTLQRRNRTGSNTFNDVQVRYQAPWNATIAVGANNVFNHLGPQMYTQPNSNVSYNGAFDIGRFLYLKYTQRF